MTFQNPTGALHPFTDSDWDVFAGATSFPDGSPPLIGHTNAWTVIVSGDDDSDRTVVQFVDDESYECWSATLPLKEDAITIAQAAIDQEPSVFLTTDPRAKYFDQIN